MRRRAELFQLLALGPMPGVGAHVAFRRQFGLLEIAQDDFGAFDDLLGHACQARHLNAVALVGAAGQDFPQKNDPIVPLAHGDIKIAQ